MIRIFLGALVCLTSLSLTAQTRTRGESDKPIEIQIFDSTKPDFNPALLPVDKHPIPASEYGDKKEQLHQKRMKDLAQKKQKAQKKSASSNAVKPKIILEFSGNVPNGSPADNEIAVSRDGYVVSAVNSNIQVYDSTGKLLSTKSLSSFITQLGSISRTSDPRLLYDVAEDRFIFVCFSGSTSTTNFIVVGFSKTSNPMNAWNFYKLNGNSFNDSTWSDYPILAISDKDLFMTWNHVKDNQSWTVGFKQSVIWQIDKSLGYEGQPLKYELWSDINFNNKPLRNICPAKYQTFDKNSNMYFLSMRNVDVANDTMFLLEITDSYASKKAKLNTKVLKTPIKYGFPPNAIQAKNANGLTQQLMTNDARVLAAIYQNDQINFGLNSTNFEFNNAGVMLGRITQVSQSNPKVYAKTFSEEDLEYGYPSMAAINPDEIPNRVLYTFSHCETEGFPGTSIVYENSRGEFNTPIKVRNGTQIIDVFSDSVERWGDYTNAQMHFNNPNVAYIVGSYGGNTGSMNNRMLTTISKISISDSLKPSSIDQSAQPERAMIFPNPYAEYFKTTIELEHKEELLFSILNLQGKKIEDLLKIEGHPGRNEFTFNPKPLPAGQYFLDIKGNKGYSKSIPIKK
ncbi:MAG: T9SS type A sorting domain-containing protein [Chitinophagales bacterium]|nr:T9SS type A sorting domain-containing protein [Chitinophagales bacterium]